jgi:hypothetical protein
MVVNPREVQKIFEKFDNITLTNIKILFYLDEIRNEMCFIKTKLNCLCDNYNTLIKSIETPSKSKQKNAKC